METQVYKVCLEYGETRYTPLIEEARQWVLNSRGVIINADNIRVQ